MAAASGSTMNGSSTCTSPITTPVGVKISRTGLPTMPSHNSAWFSTPKSPSAMSQPYPRTTSPIISGAISSMSRTPRPRAPARAS